MRAFIAFPIPESAKKEIVTETGELKLDNPKVKWVEEENLHVTLLFLGDIVSETADLICEKIRTLAENQKPFTVTYRGIGYFPPKGRPKVVHIPLRKGSEICSAFHGRLAAEVASLMPVDSRPMTPHITLGRVKGKEYFNKPLAEFPLRGSFSITRCVLFESILRPSGPVYSEFASYDFLGD